jgi:hypothetical protein
LSFADRAGRIHATLANDVIGYRGSLVATTVAPDQGWESYLSQIAIHGAPPGYPTAEPIDPGPSAAAPAAAPQAEAPAVQQAAASSFFAGFSFPAGGAPSALIPWDGGTVGAAAPAFSSASESGQAAIASSGGFFEFPFTTKWGFVPVFSDGNWTFVANFSDGLDNWFF